MKRHGQIMLVLVVVPPVIGMLVLLAWRLGVAQQLRFIDGGVTMAPLTALSLVLASPALLIRRWHAWRPLAALLCLVIGGLVLGHGATGLEAGLEQLLGSGELATRMSPLTAAAFIGLGAAVGLIELGFETAGLCVALLPWAIGAMSLLGNLFGVPDLGRDSLPPVAMLTAGCLLALTTAVMLAQEEHRYIQVLRGRSPGATLVRWTLPVILGLPVLVGGFGITVQRWGWLHSPFAVLVTMVGAMIGSAAMVVHAALAMDGYVKREQASRAEMLVAEAEVAGLLALERSRDAFYASVTHELRSPLNAITGYGSLLQEQVLGALNPAQENCMRQLMSGADELLGLVNDLLDLNRIEAGRFVLRPEPVTLGVVAREVRDRMEVLARFKGQSLEFEAAEAEPELALDRARIGQVLTNFVANAIKYSQVGARITIQIVREPEAMCCAVSDDGPGIPPEQQLRLFQRFERLDLGGIPGGTGLGLAICKGLVEAHHGTVGVDSAPGRGSSFWFRVPVGGSAAVDEPTANGVRSRQAGGRDE